METWAFVIALAVLVALDAWHLRIAARDAKRARVDRALRAFRDDMERLRAEGRNVP